MQFVFNSGSGTSDDTYITQSAATTNFGGSVVIVVGQDRQTVGKGTVDYEYRILLRFDISSIATYTIQSATLTLTNPPGYGSVSQTLIMYRCDNANWTEYGATWNTYNGTNNWSVDVGNPTTPSTTISYTGGNAVFTCTANVTDAIANRNNIVNLVIDGTTLGASVLANFGSFDNSTAAYRPQLTVNCSKASPKQAICC